MYVWREENKFTKLFYHEYSVTTIQLMTNKADQDNNNVLT